MALRIVYADADMKTAVSLAGFLKKQSIPVDTLKLSAFAAPKTGDIVVALLSRKFRSTPMADACLDALSKDARTTPHIIVSLDKFASVSELPGFVNVDASTPGQRAGKSWRDIAQIARLALASSQNYSNIDPDALLKLKKPVATAEPTTDIAEAFQSPEEPKLAVGLQSGPPAGETNMEETAEQLTKKKSVALLPVIFLLIVIIALAAGLVLLHPQSPYSEIMN